MPGFTAEKILKRFWPVEGLESGKVQHHHQPERRAGTRGRADLIVHIKLP